MKQQGRLAARYALELLNTEPERVFQDLVHLAAYVCQAPMAVFALADRDRLWYKARYGTEVDQVPYEGTFCAETLLGTEILIVPDACTDDRFNKNPLVTSPPYVRFYAGVPLLTGDGIAVGTLCVLDYVPRTLTAEQQTLLCSLADRVIEGIELSRKERESARLAAQRAEAQAALSRSKMMLQRAQGMARIGTWEYNVRTGEAVWSDEIYRIFDRDIALGPLTHEELVARYHPDDRRGVTDAVRHIVTHKQPYHLTVRILSSTPDPCTPQGHSWPPQPIRYVDVISEPMLDEQGQVTAVIGVMMDITARKQNEQMLIRQSAEIREGKDRAERASRLKSEFVASMSHEIRTPLNGVIGMTGLLLDTPLSMVQRELAQTARTSAESLLSIVNDILDFSKIEAGKLTIEPTPFDLKTVAEEVKEMLAISAHTKGLRLDLHYAPDAPRKLVGDAGRIRQILVNLVGNAVKFTPAGHVLIQIDCLRKTTQNAQMRVSVQDTGIGISVEQLAYLFEPFTQADASTTRQYGGTGLGLTICRQLAQLMSATLQAQSKPGVGSTFSLIVNLPLVRDAVPASIQEAITVDHVGTTGAVARKRVGRILVVEDNAINQRVAQLMLEKQGHRVDLAANGVEALRMWQQATYDLILMDCQMPEMDGYEATRQIRIKEAGESHTPIAALTASAMPEDEERCLAAGMDTFLTKPLRREALESLLVRALGPVDPTIA